MAHGCSRSACCTSIGWTNAHYHDGTGEADAAGHRRRDWNGRWICPALCAGATCRRAGHSYWAQDGRHFASQVDRGSASRLWGLFRPRGSALWSGRCGLLSGYVRSTRSEYRKQKKGVDKKARVMVIRLLSGHTTKSIYPTLARKVSPFVFDSFDSALQEGFENLSRQRGFIGGFNRFSEAVSSLR